MHTGYLILEAPSSRRRKLSMSGLFLIWHARASTQRTYNWGDKESPCRTPLRRATRSVKKTIDNNSHICFLIQGANPPSKIGAEAIFL